MSLVYVMYLMDRADPRRNDTKLDPESPPMNRALVLIFLGFLAGCSTPAPSPVASQSACPASLPDVDRLACWVSANPEPVDAARKPAALLRDANGNAVIGPNAPSPRRNADGSLVIGPASSQ